MHKVPDELKLAESYQFQVKVENNGTHFAGELNLTPEGCSLIVRGDIVGERTHTFEWADMDEMRCDSFEGTFILRGLEFTGGANRSLQRYPKPAGHFEIRYEVSHAMFFHHQRHRIPSFVGFVICSPSIDR